MFCLLVVLVVSTGQMIGKKDSSEQWRHHGHEGTCPLAFERKIFFTRLYVETIVWFGSVLYQTLNSALFVQPYSL